MNVGEHIKEISKKHPLRNVNLNDMADFIVFVMLLPLQTYLYYIIHCMIFLKNTWEKSKRMVFLDETQE